MGKRYILPYVFLFLYSMLAMLKSFLCCSIYSFLSLHYLKEMTNIIWLSQHGISSWSSLGHSVSEREMHKRTWDIPYSFPRRTRWASFTWRTWWTLQQKIKNSAVRKDEVLIFIKYHRHLPCVSPFQWTESTELELQCLIWVLLRYCLRSWLNFISSANKDYLAAAKKFLSYARSCSIFSAPQQLQ